MTEHELVQLASKPGALLLAIAWLYLRLNRVEVGMALIAQKLGVHLPQKPRLRGKALIGGSVLLALLGSGCKNIFR